MGSVPLKVPLRADSQNSEGDSRYLFVGQMWVEFVVHTETVLWLLHCMLKSWFHSRDILSCYGSPTLGSFCSLWWAIKYFCPFFLTTGACVRGTNIVDWNSSQESKEGRERLGGKGQEGWTEGERGGKCEGWREKGKEERDTWTEN